MRATSKARTPRETGLPIRADHHMGTRISVRARHAGLHTFLLRVLSVPTKYARRKYRSELVSLKPIVMQVLHNMEWFVTKTDLLFDRHEIINDKS